MNPAAPIGVFDSGVGGLSVLRAARHILPAENFLYFADSAFAPYGDKPDSYVIERSERIGAWFVARGAKAIVVACNTATAIAAQTLRATFDLPIVGVEPGLKPAVTATKTGKVGVFATAATLKSKRYHDLLARIQSDASLVQFVSTVGRGWVELVEHGELNSAEANERVANVVRPLAEQGCDTFVLGCTHYPFLSEAIHRASPTATIIDTAPAIARELARRVAAAIRDDDRDGQLTIFTSGDATATERVARAMLGERFANASVRAALF